MTRKIADDYEALNAGLKRIEEERLRILNGDSSPEPVAVEEYQTDVEDVGHMATPWGFVAHIPPKPKLSIQPTVGSYRASSSGIGYEYWNGKAWVDWEEWLQNGDQS